MKFLTLFLIILFTNKLMACGDATMHKIIPIGSNSENKVFALEIHIKRGHGAENYSYNALFLYSVYNSNFERILVDTLLYEKGLNQKKTNYKNRKIPH